MSQLTNVPMSQSLEALMAEKRAEFAAAGFTDEEIRAALELLLAAADDEPNAEARGVLAVQVQVKP